MTSTKLIAECERRGVRLEPRGENLWIEPPERTTPELVEEIRAHKREILAALEARRQAPLLELAMNILRNEFGGCDARTANRAAIELQTLPRSFVRDAALVKLGQEATP
jgi:hypothetical protein